MGHSAGLHNGLHVREVQVDHGRHSDQVADALDALAEHVIRDLESFDHGGSLVDNLQQAVIGDHNQRIHMLLQLGNTGFRVLHALFAFEVERLGYNSDGQCSEIPRDFRHNGSRAGTGAAAHTGGNKHQVRALQGGSDLFTAFFSRAAAHLRDGAGAEALGQLFADLDFHLCVGLAQGLPVRIYGDKFYPAQAGVDHAVNGVVAAAAATNHLNAGEGALFFVLELNHALNLPTDCGKSL